MISKSSEYNDITHKIHTLFTAMLPAIRKITVIDIIFKNNAYFISANARSLLDGTY